MAMDTKIKSVEVLPLVKYYIEELKLAQIFDKYIPNTNGAEIPAAQVLSVMVMNVVTASKPLYRNRSLPLIILLNFFRNRW